MRPGVDDLNRRLDGLRSRLARAERRLLSTLINQPSIAVPDDLKFTHPKNQAVLQAIRACDGDGTEHNLVNVAQALQRSGDMGLVGIAFLAETTSIDPYPPFPDMLMIACGEIGDLQHRYTGAVDALTTAERLLVDGAES